MLKFDTPANLGQWVVRIEQAGLPVLQRTIDGLEQCRADEDHADAQVIAGLVLQDPLMTVKVLAHMAALRSRRIDVHGLTVNGAVQLMGVPPFLTQFRQLPSLEESLSEWPAAVAGVTAVLGRSYRAARLALGYAVHRGDLEAELLHQAALLHDFAELLIWGHAPALALQMEAAAAADPQLTREWLEHQTLGIGVNELEQALMLAWGLPPLLTRVTDDRHADTPRVRTVVLATRIARHSEAGWSDPRLFEDFDALGGLLGITPVVAQRKTMELLGEGD